MTGTCYDGTGRWRTHYLFAADQSYRPNITLCGLRQGEVVDGLDVNCDECVEIKEEVEQYEHGHL